MIFNDKKTRYDDIQTLADTCFPKKSLTYIRKLWESVCGHLKKVKHTTIFVVLAIQCHEIFAYKTVLRDILSIV